MKSTNQQRWTGLPIVLLAMVLGFGWITAAGGCVGTGGGSGNGNDNGNMNGGNTNDNGDNGNAANDNSGNDNTNTNDNSGDNANNNDGDNSNGNGNDNDNGGDNSNDNGAPTDPGLLATSQRSAFQSQCAQNVLECTTIWPEAVAILDLSRRGPDQAFSFLGGGRFIVTGTDGDGSEPVPLRGEQSALGDDATILTFSWSHAATDADKCTLVPGPVFSTDPNPLQRMEVGFHYIRLTVTNDNLRDIFSDECGLIAESSGLFDFVEIEIEVREQ